MRLIDADADALIARINNSFGSVTRFIIKSILKDAPTIEAEPVRHGRWVPVDCEHPCDEWDCTACGGRRTFLTEMDADDMKECYPYCPNCGAKMDGGTAGATN